MRIGICVMAMSNGVVIQGHSIRQGDIEAIQEMIVSKPSWRQSPISQEM